MPFQTVILRLVLLTQLRDAEPGVSAPDFSDPRRTLRLVTNNSAAVDLVQVLKIYQFITA